MITDSTQVTITEKKKLHLKIMHEKAKTGGLMVKYIAPSFRVPWQKKTVKKGKAPVAKKCVLDHLTTFSILFVTLIILLGPQFNKLSINRTAKILRT